VYELFNWPATAAVYAAIADKVKDKSLGKMMSLGLNCKQQRPVKRD